MPVPPPTIRTRVMHAPRREHVGLTHFKPQSLRDPPHLPSEPKAFTVRPLEAPPNTPNTPTCPRSPPLTQNRPRVRHCTCGSTPLDDASTSPSQKLHSQLAPALSCFALHPRHVSSPRLLFPRREPRPTFETDDYTCRGRRGLRSSLRPWDSLA